MSGTGWRGGKKVRFYLRLWGGMERGTVGTEGMEMGRGAWVLGHGEGIRSPGEGGGGGGWYQDWERC